METVPLFTSQLLTIREVVCDAPRGGACGVEHSLVPCIAMPLRGCYTVDRQRQSVVADANTAVFFDAGSYRVAHPADEGDVSFVIVCEPAAVADAFGNAARPDPERRPFRATHAQVEGRVQLRTQLLRRALRCSGVEPLAAEEEAFAILADLAGTRASVPNPACRAVVERAKVFLNQHFADQISLADAARAAGTSPFSLSRVFPAAAGTTLHRYLISLRLASALDAIAAGATDLSRVAVDAGFAHHSHFSKTFARVFGATPRAIRRRLDDFKATAKN